MIEKRLDRIILDTNTLISAAIYPNSTPGQVVTTALRNGIVLRSEATWQELEDVASRPKFDRYKPGEFRRSYIDALRSVTKLVGVVDTIRLCRHPKNDKFLELALSVEADLLVTGDADLLTLHPFHRTTILTPAAYLFSQAVRFQKET